ncbi:MAG: hypothetical protein U0324_43115 [Polyangiales bacterium]
MQFHSVLRALSLFGVVALLGLRAGESSDSVAHASVRPEPAASALTVVPSAEGAVDRAGQWRLALGASVPHEGPAAALQASLLPAEPATTAAEMQLALAGVVGRAAHLGRGVVMEDARCDEAAGGDCGASFLREVAAIDPAAAEALAPAVARLGESVGTLRVTRWTVEGDGATARSAVTVQGLRDGRVAGLAVYR